MLKKCYTIMNFLQRSLSHRRLFLELLWLRLIGTPPRMLKDADGTKIAAWIDLKPWFQFLSFMRNFQFAMACLCAACSPFGIRSWFWSYREAIRLKILNKIHGHNGFWRFDFHDLFHIFSICNLVQIWSILIKTCLIKKCTKYWPWNVHKKIFLG